MGVGNSLVEGMLRDANARFINEVKEGNYEKLLKQMAFTSEYSVNNQMLLGMQNIMHTKLRTFEEWESYGRHVKKGEKSVRIVVPRPASYSRKTDCTLALGWVFDIDQTYGQEQEPMTLAGIYKVSPQGLIEGIKAQLAGYKIQSMQRTAGCDAVIDTSKREICINEELPQDKYLKLLIQQVIIAKSLQQKEESPKIEGFSANMARFKVDSATFAVMANLGMEDQISKEIIHELSQMNEGQLMSLKEVFVEISDMANMIIEGTLESCLSGRPYTKNADKVKEETGKELVA